MSIFKNPLDSTTNPNIVTLYHAKGSMALICGETLGFVSYSVYAYAALAYFPWNFQATSWNFSCRTFVMPLTILYIQKILIRSRTTHVPIRTNLSKQRDLRMCRSEQTYQNIKNHACAGQNKPIKTLRQEDWITRYFPVWMTLQFQRWTSLGYNRAECSKSDRRKIREP